MTNMTRMGFAAVVLAMAVTGCNCGTPARECSDIRVTFDSPAEGATVSSPFAAKISATYASDGTAVEFDTAKLTVAGGSFDGTISGSSANFAAVTAAAGDQVLTATVTKGACSVDATETANRIAAATRNVKVQQPCSPKVTKVTFTQDTNANGILNSAELGGATTFRVKVDGTCTVGAQVRIVNSAGLTMLTSAVAFASGSATLEVPITGDAQYDIFAQIVSSTGTALNTTTGNPEGLGSIKIRQTNPTCMNTTVLLNGPKTDAAMGTSFDLRATGNAAPGTTAVFSIAGGESSPMLTPVGGMVSADFLLPKASATFSLTLKVTDADLNVCTDQKTVTLDFTQPTVVITTPAKPDSGSAAVVNVTDVIASVTENGPVNCTACATLSRRQGTAAFQDYATVDVLNGVATFPGVTFPATGVFDIKVSVSDVLGNIGSDTESISATVTTCPVDYLTPSTMKPGACPKTIFGRDLSGGAYPISFSSLSCVGHAARLSVTGPTTATASGTVNGSGIFGPNSIPLSNGTYTIHGEVDNTVGGPSSGNCVLTVDTSQPAILNPAPPGPVLINANQDTNPGRPGAQRTINFTATLTSGAAHADLCTTQQVDPVTTMTRSACPDAVVGWYLLQANVPVPVVGTPTVVDYPEGQYQIKIVVVDGASTNASDPVAVNVDVTRPCVSAAGLTFDRDNGAGNGTYAADGRINILENAQSGLPTLSFTPGCGDTTTTLTPTSVVVAQVVGSNAPSALPGTITQTVVAAGAKFNVVLGGLTGDSAYRLYVQLTDVAGNVSLYAGTTDPGTGQIRFDLAPTSCAITAPNASPLGQAAVPGGSLTVRVSTDSDVGANGVQVAAPGATPATQTVTPAGNEATATLTVTDGSYAITAACTDASGNTTPATVSPSPIVVDLTPPQNCTLVSPSSTGGPASNGVYASGSIASTFTATGANGRTVTFSSTLGGTITTATLVSNTASDLNSTYNAGTQVVTATVSDAAGNSCSATSNITVSGCGVSVKTADVVAPNNVLFAGTYLNRNNTTPAGPNTGSVTLVATGCANEQLTLTRTSPGGFTPIVQTTDGTGVTTFPAQTISEGDVWTVANGLGTTRTMTVDLVAPAATGYLIASGTCPGNAPACNSTDTTPLTGTALSFVAAAGNRKASLGTAGYFADSSAGQAGSQFQVTVRGVSGAAGGTVDLLSGTTAFNSQPGTAAATDVSLGTLSLPEGPSAPFVIRVTDIGGNVTNVLSGTAVVDVTNPADPAATNPAAPTRGGQLNLSWSPVADASSPVTYEVGWTTSTLATAGINNESTYFTTATVTLVPVGAGLTTAQLSLPPLTTYSVAVRAIDAVGNYSLFAPGSVLSIPNTWNLITLTDGAASSSFGSTVVSADVVAGGSKDIIVGAPGAAATAVGAVYVFTGGASLANLTCPTGCTAIVPPDGQVGQFGADISVDGNVSDVGSPNDLVIGQPRWSSSLGRVFIYFGTTGAAINTATGQYVEIRGNATNTFFGQSVKIIGDIDGDGRDEVAIATPTWDTTNTDVTKRNVGRIYIFKGRDFTAWQALAAGGPVGLGSADWVIDGPARRCNAAGTVCGNAFGVNRYGLVNFGKVGGATGSNFFGIPLSRGYWSTEQLWNGATVAAQPYTNDAGVPSSSAVSTISKGAFDSNASNGFGFAAAAGSILDLNGTGSNAFDLAITAPASNTLYIYGDMLTTGFGGTAPSSVVGPNSFGGAVAIGDLTDDGLTDIVASESGATPTAAWVVVQVAGTGFAPSLPAPQSAALRGPATSFQGAGITIGNLTGHTDGKNDLAVGDSVLQTVKIWK